MKLDYNEKYPREEIEYETFDEPMALAHDWQWDMLREALTKLREDGILNSEEWEVKAGRKQISLEELAWINTIMISRMKGDK